VSYGLARQAKDVRRRFSEGGLPIPRDAQEFDDSHGRVYDKRDRGDDDPRDSLMRNLDLPRGDERELVADRDLGPVERSRVLAASGQDPEGPSVT
jgi:hypothetical protein